MTKRLSALFIVFLMSFFTLSSAKAAVLPWEPVVDATHGGGPGFGNEANALSTSMVTFKGYIYTGSVNNVQGSEIWRSADGTTWTQANESGFGTHSLSYTILGVLGDSLYAILCGPGLNSAYRTTDGTHWDLAKTDIGSDDGITVGMIMTMATYNNVLYVGGINANTGEQAMVMGTTDGNTWHEVNTPAFGVVDNSTVTALTSFNNKLYAGVKNIGGGGASVWAYDGLTWTKDTLSGFDDIQNYDVGGLVAFAGKLYATTENNSTGAEVWRTSGDSNWERVVDTGFGQDLAITVGYSGIVFGDYLYVGTEGAKLFRTADGTTWTSVNNDGFSVANADYPVFAVLGDYIYVGTGTLPQGGPNTIRIYRYGTPTPVLPQTGVDSLNAYILDAIL